MRFHELWRAKIESTETTVSVTIKEHNDGQEKKFILQRDEVFELLVKWGLI
jgi:hypothetical protein